jgi:hypothetical protein
MRHVQGREPPRGPRAGVACVAFEQTIKILTSRAALSARHETRNEGGLHAVIGDEMTPHPTAVIT